MGSKTIKSLFVIAGMAAVLSGCDTLDPYTGESETSKATFYLPNGFRMEALVPKRSIGRRHDRPLEAQES